MRCKCLIHLKLISVGYIPTELHRGRDLLFIHNRVILFSVTYIFYHPTLRDINVYVSKCPVSRTRL
jgi:hypothetical protein